MPRALLVLMLTACVDRSKVTPHGAPILLGVSAHQTPLQPGARPAPDRKEGTDLLPEIAHIVVLMMENHSFDNYFGALGRGDGLTIGEDGVATEYNLDAEGKRIFAYHLTTTSQEGSRVSPGWTASHLSFAGGTNSGFVTANRATDTMGYFNSADIPYYYAIGSVFPIGDRYFSSVLGPTYPNRRFLASATANGIVSTELSALTYNNPPPSGTIFDKLDGNGIGWRNYTALLAELALYPSTARRFSTHLGSMEDFFADAAAGTFPGYSLVTPSPGVSEEDPQDIRAGAAFAQSVIEAVLRSPAWSKTLLVFTYDEGGGYFDHVPPPEAFPPDDVAPDATRTGGIDVPYDHLGFRVPAVVMSPYARPNYVSHVVHDHTSILRLIETKWNLGALTRRDANASNLLDMLDLWGPPAFKTAPTF